jgi:hypothetical protein
MREGSKNVDLMININVLCWADIYYVVLNSMLGCIMFLSIAQLGNGRFRKTETHCTVSLNLGRY